jgi:hypothetical protein
MERITLHVPEVLNDGSPVPAETLEEYEDAMGTIALESLMVGRRGSRGVTVSPGQIGIWWDQDDRKYRERYTLYVMDVYEVGLAFDLTCELAARIKVELGQAGVYVTRFSIDATVVEYVTA